MIVLTLRCSSVDSRPFRALLCCPQVTCDGWAPLQVGARGGSTGIVDSAPISSTRYYAPSHGKPISSLSFCVFETRLGLIV